MWKSLSINYTQFNHNVGSWIKQIECVYDAIKLQNFVHIFIFYLHFSLIYPQIMWKTLLVF